MYSGTNRTNKINTEEYFPWLVITINSHELKLKKGQLFSQIATL